MRREDQRARLIAHDALVFGVGQIGRGRLALDPCEQQRRQVKRAFYAGAISLLGVLDELSEPEVSENAGVAVLASLHQEARAYGAAIQTGKE